MRRTLFNVAEPEPYSVRCEHCDTSFAPETKQCIHCGAPLGSGLLAALRSAGGELGGGGAAQEVEEADETPARNRMWVVMALLAMGFSMLRQCL